MEQTLAAIKREGSSAAFQDSMISFSDREEIIGTKAWLDRDKAYAV